MDFRDSPDEAAFRGEIRDWLSTAMVGIPKGSTIEDQHEREEVGRDWARAIYEGGWAGINWPVEYGGRGLSMVHEAIFQEELALVDAPYPVNSMGITLTGNTILVYGTDDQKRRYLPRILSGEDIWCQGFSEPGAGSDLASLSTRGVATDGGWSLSGQKVWTSNGHLANKCMLLARTDPDATKHRGISYFLSDMDQIDVRPLVMINGDAEFNEMFIDGQFVSDEDVLGAVNDGWRVANTTLAFERTTVALNLQVWSLQMLDRLVALVRRLELTDDESVLERVAEFYELTHAVRISSVQTMSLVAAGGQPGPGSSGVKLVWAALMQQMSRFALELAGTDGQIVDRPEPGYWVHRYLRARGHSIEGGSDEVQKSIIAEHVLGLPRSR